jgi:hypothetical protein
MATDLGNIGYIDSPVYSLNPLLPRYSGGLQLVASGAAPTPVPPVVSNVTPTPGTAITTSTPISLDVTDDANSFLRILLAVSFPDGTKEVAFDGAGFTARYSNPANTQTSITNGYRFTVLRNGGWPDLPEITPFVIDTTGGEAA